MSLRLAAVAVAALIGLFAAHAAKAQDGPPIPERAKAEVMVLGVFHFDNAGLDAVIPPSGDIMGDRFQAELEAITDALAAWNPTKVMVEATPDRQADFDALYAAWRAGERELEANERQQIGFRIAGELDLPRVHAVDHKADMDFAGAMAAMEAAGQDALAAHVGATISGIRADMEDPAQGERSIAERLIEHNDPARLNAMHGFYLDLAEAGDAENPKGAEVVGGWWTRNMHIYANVARLAEGGDRVLVIFGSGHAYTLRSFFEHSDRFTLVEPTPYLATAAP